MSAEALRRGGVAVLVAVWATGCLTLEPAVGPEEGRVAVCGGMSAPPGWPGEAEGEELLGPFLECGGPGDFVEMQGGVDMPRVVGRLDEWRAVRLGALGPGREDAAGGLNGKRAAVLRRGAGGGGGEGGGVGGGEAGSAGAGEGGRGGSAQRQESGVSAAGQ